VEVKRWECDSGVRHVVFNQGDSEIVFVTDATMGQVSTIHVVSVQGNQWRSVIVDPLKITATEKSNNQSTIVTTNGSKTNTIHVDRIVMKHNKTGLSKVTKIEWAGLNEFWIAGHEDGTISKWSVSVMLID
jgi:WD40 repeat protein